MKSKEIDSKYSIGVNENGEPFLFKTTNNQPIPDNEPVILFRGRDRLAVEMLHFYKYLCGKDGATDYQMKSMDSMIQRFTRFAMDSPTMKQPGITKGE